MELSIESKLRIRETVLDCKQDDGVDSVIDVVLAEVLPVVLAEPSQAEVDQVVRKGLGFGPIAKVSPDFHYGARLVITNRLARFTSPKDADEPIRDLFAATQGLAMGSGKQHDDAVREAYRRGLQRVQCARGF